MSSIKVSDCNEFLKNINDNTIALTVTSPPYDNIRDYNGHNTFDLHVLGKELYRCTVDGGIACVNIQDGTANFAKSLTSFKLAIDWCNSGWKLFECCIYSKNGRPGKWWNKRFRVDHEYIMIFFKGDRPRYFNKEHMKIPCSDKYANTTKLATVRQTDGSLKENMISIGSTKCPGTIWHYKTASQEKFNANTLKFQHPATMPEKLANDLILCFSQPNDIVCDPFVGSGTTAVNAINLGRFFVGCDISKEYVELTNRRLESETGKT